MAADAEGVGPGRVLPRRVGRHVVCAKRYTAPPRGSHSGRLLLSRTVCRILSVPAVCLSRRGALWSPA